MNNYIISEEIRNNLLQYLMHKPMLEVERAVFELRNLPGFLPAEETAQVDAMGDRQKDRDRGRIAETTAALR